MARIRPLSGFPEFLPAQRVVEMRALDLIRQTFELHGFANIETRAVETLDSLTRKGEITKEVYVVRRIHATEDATDDLGLHFDLTVPFARYILENSHALAFPFRRYQIQKVWRGERPQEGRYREFVQADIDIVGENTLAAHHDTEVLLVMLDVFEQLHAHIGVPQARFHVSNRKLAEGFYRGLGIEDTASVLQRVDKLDKIGPEAVRDLLTSEVGVSEQVAEACLKLATICTDDLSFIDQVKALGVRDEMLDEGLDLLAQLMSSGNAHAPGRMLADLKIARGLDYYTGTVYETELLGGSAGGSVSSGGRYDALASDGKRTYPGVGISLGLTRLLAPMMGRGEVSASRPVPSCVVVAVDTEETRHEAMQVATALRTRGIPCEVAPKADKFGKQIRYADRRGVPYVWFGAMQGQVKDIRSGEQVDADASTWMPPADDLYPQVQRPE